LSIVKKISYGNVATYKMLADLSENSKFASLVGKVLSMTDYYDVYPCYRVVNFCSRIAP